MEALAWHGMVIDDSDNYLGLLYLFYGSYFRTIFISSKLNDVGNKILLEMVKVNTISLYLLF